MTNPSPEGGILCLGHFHIYPFIYNIQEVGKASGIQHLYRGRQKIKGYAEETEFGAERRWKREEKELAPLFAPVRCSSVVLPDKVKGGHHDSSCHGNRRSGTLPYSQLAGSTCVKCSVHYTSSSSPVSPSVPAAPPSPPPPPHYYTAAFPVTLTCPSQPSPSSSGGGQYRYAGLCVYSALFISWLLNVPATCKANLRDGSAWTIRRAATLRYKLHAKHHVNVY